MGKWAPYTEGPDNIGLFVKIEWNHTYVFMVKTVTVLLLLEYAFAIDLFIVSDASFSRSLRKRPPRWWPRQKSLLLSLSTHSILANSISPPLSGILPCMYSFILSFHFTTGFPLLNFTHIAYTFFTNSSLNMTKPPQSISFHSFHFTTLNSNYTVPCHTFRTRFHCSHPLILLCHMLPPDNSLLLNCQC